MLPSIVNATPDALRLGRLSGIGAQRSDEADVAMQDFLARRAGSRAACGALLKLLRGFMPDAATHDRLGRLLDAAHEAITAGDLPETLWQRDLTVRAYEAWRVAMPEREWRLLVRLVAGWSAVRSSPG